MKAVKNVCILDPVQNGMRWGSVGVRMSYRQNHLLVATETHDRLDEGDVDPPRVPIPMTFVEAPCSVVVVHDFEAHRDKSGGASPCLDRVEQRSTHTQATGFGSNSDETQLQFSGAGLRLKESADECAYPAERWSELPNELVLAQVEWETGCVGYCCEPENATVRVVIGVLHSDHDTLRPHGPG